MFMTDSIQKNYFKVAEVAEIYGVHPRTIARWIKRGLFPNARKLDPSAKNSHFVIPRQDLESFDSLDKTQESKKAAE